MWQTGKTVAGISHRGEGFRDWLDAHVFLAENSKGELSFSFLLRRMGHDVVRVSREWPSDDNKRTEQQG